MQLQAVTVTGRQAGRQAVTVTGREAGRQLQAGRYTGRQAGRQLQADTGRLVNMVLNVHRNHDFNIQADRQTGSYR